MKLQECIKQKGLQIEVMSLKRCQSVDIAFLNSDGMEDETQFDVMFIGTRAGNKELEQLYDAFCKENKFPTNTVQSVTVVKSANSFAGLEKSDLQK